MIEAQGRRWNVNPFFIAAIAGVESSFGAAACGGNAWGIGSCSVSYADFATGAAAVAQLLRTGYLNRGLTDVWSIGRVYCPPCSPPWGDRVAYFMQSRFHTPVTVSYPGG